MDAAVPVMDNVPVTVVAQPDLPTVKAVVFVPAMVSVAVPAPVAAPVSMVTAPALDVPPPPPPEFNVRSPPAFPLVSDAPVWMKIDPGDATDAVAMWTPFTSDVRLTIPPV